MPSPAETRSELARLRKEVGRLRRALKLLTPGLETLLRRRGFTIYKREPSDDLLVPARRFHASYYRMMHKYSFRLFLRDVIRLQKGFTAGEVSRYATPAVTKSYIEYLLSVRLIRKSGSGFALAKKGIRSFGPALEWFVAELLRREFAAEAVWGVKFRRPKVGGDYDVLAKMDGSLLYIEAKSSPPKQIYDSEVAAFLDRVEDLAPDIAVFFMDTELRMKDKLVPMFEAELGRRSADPPEVRRMERELFEIGGRVFIVNAKESVLRNFEKVIAWQYRRQSKNEELRSKKLFHNS